MRTVLFHNSTAGLAWQVAENVRELSREPPLKVVPLERGSDEKAAWKAALAWNADRWVIAGGDGTVHRVIQHPEARNGRCEIVVIPCGTGNDFARSLGTSLTDLDAACLQPHFGRSHDVDLIEIHDRESDRTRWCLNAASGGVGGAITARLQATDKRLWGAFAYWIGLIGELVDLHGYQVRLEMTSDASSKIQIEEFEAFALIVANGRFVGGGYPIAPDALIDDGLLDLTVVPTLPTLDLLAAGLATATGHLEHTPSIRRYRLRELRIQAAPRLPFSIDGEPTESLDANFKVHPGALRVRVGADAPGLNPNTSRIVTPSIFPNTGNPPYI